MDKKQYYFYKYCWDAEGERIYGDSQHPVRQYRTQRQKIIFDELTADFKGRVLEVGCGYGRMSEILLQHKDIYLIGIDLSSSMVNNCKERLLDSKNFVILQANAAALPFKNNVFDNVFCISMLIHSDNQPVVLGELFRVISKKGRLLFTGNNLLSIFAILTIFWRIFRKGNIYMSYKTGLFYIKKLKESGFKVQKVMTDTLLGIDKNIPFSKKIFPFYFLVPLFKLIDKITQKNFMRYFGYELWFLAVKE